MSSPWLGLQRYASPWITESVVLVSLLRVTHKKRSFRPRNFIGETVNDYSFMRGPDELPAITTHPDESPCINQTNTSLSGNRMKLSLFSAPGSYFHLRRIPWDRESVMEQIGRERLPCGRARCLSRG